MSLKYNQLPRAGRAGLFAAADRTSRTKENAPKDGQGPADEVFAPREVFPFPEGGITVCKVGSGWTGDAIRPAGSF